MTDTRITKQWLSSNSRDIQALRQNACQINHMEQSQSPAKHTSLSQQ